MRIRSMRSGRPTPRPLGKPRGSPPGPSRRASRAWITVDYWGVHAYTLTNGKGEATVAKLKWIAAAGQLGLSEDELKAKPDSFYADELKERLSKGPASF